MTVKVRAAIINLNYKLSPQLNILSKCYDVISII